MTEDTHTQEQHWASFNDTVEKLAALLLNEEIEADASQPRAVLSTHMTNSPVLHTAIVNRVMEPSAMLAVLMEGMLAGMEAMAIATGASDAPTGRTPLSDLPEVP